MGIPRGSVELLMAEGQVRPFNGRLLQLGRQDTHFTYEQLKQFAKEASFPLSPVQQITLHMNPFFHARGTVSDESFFLSMGFSSSEVLDASDYESANYVFDLNEPVLPDHLTNKFDVIYDGGTFEHVFHMPNAFNNIFKMLKVGGRMIHLAPSSNHIDHGFYMICPTLFWDFYSSNDWEINTSQLIRFIPPGLIDRWRIYEYSPGCLFHVSSGGLDNAGYLVNFITTKTENSTSNRIPAQGLYQELWKQKMADGGAAPLIIKISEAEAASSIFSIWNLLKKSGSRSQHTVILFVTLIAQLLRYSITESISLWRTRIIETFGSLHRERHQLTPKLARTAINSGKQLYKRCFHEYDRIRCFIQQRSK